MASASPRASITVVDAVGARPIPQASCSTLRSSATSLPRARVEFMAQQKLMRASPTRLIAGSKRRISSVSPLEERASTRSPWASIPRSPCSASAACRNKAGVPVELKVATTFCAIIPLLPMPVTTTRPRRRPQSTASSTARAKSADIPSSRRAASRSSASASMRINWAGVSAFIHSQCKTMMVAAP